MITKTFWLLAALRWGAQLPLTQKQRYELEGLCCKIGACVPRVRLKQEAEAKRAAEKRESEVEAALKSRREEWVFRRKPRVSN